MNADETFKKLQSVFKSSAHNNLLEVHHAQQAAWEFGIYPTKSQFLELCLCQRDEACKGIQFYEFCVLIATVKYHINKDPPSQIARNIYQNSESSFESQWDVFLGGACNPTTWRFDEAIPFLLERNISFYNPQKSTWTSELIQLEAFAKDRAKVQLFVITWETRGLASLVEVAYLAGKGHNLILVLPRESPSSHQFTIGGEKLLPEEFDSIQRGHLFLMDLVERQGIPVFDNISAALNCVQEIIETSCNVRDLTEKSGAIPVRHSYVKIGHTITTLKEAFRSLDHKGVERITRSEAEMGLRVVLGRRCTLSPQVSKSSCFTFQEFCLLYSQEVLHHLEKSPTNPTCPSQIPPVQSSGRTRHSSTSLLARLWSSIVNTCRRRFNSSPAVPASRQQTPPNVARKMSCRTAGDLDPETGTMILERYKYDVFLGGSCGLSGWRSSIAVPQLRRAGCSYYNPQTAVWTTRLLPVDAEARHISRVLLFAVTRDTFSTASIVEAAHFIGLGRCVVLYVELFDSQSSPLPSASITPATLSASPPDSELTVPSPPVELSEQGLRDHNRGRQYLVDLANQAKVPIVESLEEAVQLCLEEVRRDDAWRE